MREAETALGLSNFSNSKRDRQIPPPACELGGVHLRATIEVAGGSARFRTFAALDIEAPSRWPRRIAGIKNSRERNFVKATAFLSTAIWLILSVPRSHAGSATWLSNPTSADWNTTENWTPGGPPNSTADTATFQVSTLSNLSLSANTQVNGILFANGATAYSIAASDSFVLAISGWGIRNDSSITQNFVASGTGGVIQFVNSATGGLDTAFTTHGAEVAGPVAGLTEFRGNSSAGHAAFTTHAGPVSGAFGGVTQFFESSTAGHGVFLTHGRTLSDAGSGAVLFFNTSGAGDGNFTTNGGAANGALGGFVIFFDNSTADHGRFINNGGEAFKAQGGIADFYDTSSAGNGAFDIQGGAVTGADAAFVRFFDSATAANATFLNRGGPISGAAGGTLEFHHNSSAGNASIVTSGAEVNFAGFAYTVFHDNSTAANATFIIEGGASAGEAGSGLVEFIDDSTAGSATFTINGAPVLDGYGGYMGFRNRASAENATVILNGGTFPGAGSASIQFLETATAANATLIANGGTQGGEGALILFAIESEGATARLKVFGNAQLDISGLFGTFYDPQNDPGTTIGSLEGDGLVFLGANRLSIGANGLNTTFSGVIQDSGVNDGGGGSLAKIGPGTLTLSGANTYTGVTTINEGTLRVDGSITSAVTITNGGTLGGSGTAASVTVESGGILAPGDSIGVFTINGSYTQKAGGVLKLEVAGTDPGASDRLDIAGSATIDGTLEVRFLNGFVPVTGQVFKLFNVAGAFAGSFAQIIFPDLRTGFRFNAEFVNGSYQVTALNDAVAAHGFLNISTRARVGTGDNALIGGFIITGNAAKKVIIRALGPSLAVNGTPVPDRLTDPTLELRDEAGSLIFSNDNWGDGPQKQQITESTIPPSDPREAAIVATLVPGSYTAVMRGVNNTTGIGLVEVYDLANDIPSSMANVSSRGLVETDDNVMIAGFIVDSQAPQVIVRANGPSLTQSGIANALADPTLELFNGDGSIVAFNNDWQDSDKEAIEATRLPPVHDKESAILSILAPGTYTAIVRGHNETIGVGVVELYRVD